MGALAKPANHLELAQTRSGHAVAVDGGPPVRVRVPGLPAWYEGRVSASDLGAPIRTQRLDLVLLPRAWLDAYAAGEPLPDLGFDDPYDVLRQKEGLVRMRTDQLAADPAQEPWLLRMMVLRAASGSDRAGSAIGYANFHAPPDERGMVEIGYQVEASLRGQGYASEAATAMWEWAARHGARILRASIAPDNAPSIALVRRAGFRPVGEQIDDIDGLEVIWEREVDTARAPT